MTPKSFLRRIFSLGRGGESPADAPAVEPMVGEATLSAAPGGEAALRPSIADILFKRHAEEAPGEAPAADVGVAEEESLAPERAAERHLSRREETAQKLSEGLECMSVTLRSINDKLEAGNDRSRLLADTLEELPEVLRSIPETNRATVEFLGTISKQLDLQAARSADLAERLGDLPEILRSIPAGQAAQAAELRGIADRLSVNSTAQLDHLETMQRSQHATLSAFQNTQNRSLNLFHKAQQQSLAAFKSAQTAQAEQMQDFVARTQRTMNRALIACAAIAGASVVAALALVLLR